VGGLVVEVYLGEQEIFAMVFFLTALSRTAAVYLPVPDGERHHVYNS
jgi:hypothetical protein